MRNQFLNDNRLVISILSIWVFIHFVILSSLNNSSDTKEGFYPLESDLSLIETYDLTEFLAYGIFPVLVFFITKLLVDNNNTRK
jgi:hypothetical protein